jgi:hypothetical protein
MNSIPSMQKSTGGYCVLRANRPRGSVPMTFEHFVPAAPRAPPLFVGLTFLPVRFERIL